MKKLKSNYDEFDKKLDEIIKSNNYEELINYCNLKHEIVTGLVNTMELNYEQKAFSRIKYNKKLQKTLKDKILNS